MGYYIFGHLGLQIASEKAGKPENNYEGLRAQVCVIIFTCKKRFVVQDYEFETGRTQP